ncbi:MAG TPA: HIT domain-containing protein [Victivallales bacterium]|nr:HIT domain-containing protein [Victivallales bacterium]HRR05900.1 HIT domain-containing protein [Victivallales bacterium]HRR28929.1 HIT domain-containing protein [Victivallales bacterium]
MPEKKRREKDGPIWAPWRIEYIISPKDGSCFLCGKEKIPSDDENFIIFRGKKAFVILNRYPYNSGHLMIAPYRHISLYSFLEKDERMEISDLTVNAEKTLRQIMKPDGFNIGFNIGKAAGAGVEEHIHLHIVPRWFGDNNFMPVLADIRVVPQALIDTAELLKKNWIN